MEVRLPDRIGHWLDGHLQADPLMIHWSIIRIHNLKKMHYILCTILAPFVNKKFGLNYYPFSHKTKSLSLAKLPLHFVHDFIFNFK